MAKKRDGWLRRGLVAKKRDECLSRGMTKKRDGWLLRGMGGYEEVCVAKNRYGG